MKIWKKYTRKQRLFLLQKIKWTCKEKFKINKLLLNKNFEQFNKKDWLLLEKVWIVNWVWPWYLLRFFWIKFITGIIFFSVDYRRHDVNYFMWGDEVDREKADNWLLKYSILSIFNFMKQFSFTENLYKNIFLFILYLGICFTYFFLMNICIILVIFAYFSVRAFWEKSFNYINLN